MEVVGYPLGRQSKHFSKLFKALIMIHIVIKMAVLEVDNFLSSHKKLKRLIISKDLKIIITMITTGTAYKREIGRSVPYRNSCKCRFSKRKI